MSARGGMALRMMDADSDTTKKPIVNTTKKTAGPTTMKTAGPTTMKKTPAPTTMKKTPAPTTMKKTPAPTTTKQKIVKAVKTTVSLPYKVVDSVTDKIGNRTGMVGAMKSTFGNMATTGIGSAISTIVFFFALYLAFKCKAPGGGIDIMQLLLACCCAPCYVVYRLAVPCK
jgi:hypothetical protein